MTLFNCIQTFTPLSQQAIELAKLSSARDTQMLSLNLITEKKSLIALGQRGYPRGQGATGDGIGMTLLVMDE